MEGRDKYRQSDRRADRKVERPTLWQAVRQTDRQLGSYTDRQTRVDISKYFSKIV